MLRCDGSGLALRSVVMLLVCLVGMMLPVGLSAMISVLLVREGAIHDGMGSGAEAPCMSLRCASPSNCMSSPLGEVVVELAAGNASGV